MKLLCLERKGADSMKIVVPIEEDEMELCPSFGRAPQFYVYDTDTATGTVIENDAIHTPGGAGIKAAQTVIDVGAEVVLLPRCGENAAKVLAAANVQLYQSVGSSVTGNIQAFLANQLTVLTEIHPGFHGHGGR